MQGEGPVSVSEDSQEGDHNPGVREAGACQALAESTWCTQRSQEFKCDSGSQNLIHYDLQQKFIFKIKAN